MSKLEKNMIVPRKKNVPASKSRDEATGKEKSQAVKGQRLETEAIERAVYDGMQDLRVKKFKS